MPSEAGTSCSAVVSDVAVPASVSTVSTLAETPPHTWEKWELSLASKTATKLRRRFPQKPRFKVINELLDGMREERQARERLNLNHWPEYGPRFLETLAENWRVEEAKRLDAIPAFLKATRKQMLGLALAVTDNLPDAEAAIAESELEYLTGAVLNDASYPITVKRNALDEVKRRERGSEVLTPLERVFEAGDDCAGEADADSDGVAKVASQPKVAGSDGRDPLQVLLDRKSRHLRRSNLSRAKKRLASRRKHKDSRRKKWAGKLGIGPESGADSPR